MALEDLTPAVRVEAILDGADIDPATRLEYFLSKAANEVPKPTGSSDAGKVLTVNSDGDGFILDEVDPGLPDITGVSDAGKVVTVNSGGTAYELATPSAGGGVNILNLTDADLVTEIYGIISTAALASAGASGAVQTGTATLSEMSAATVAELKTAVLAFYNSNTPFIYNYDRVYSFPSDVIYVDSPEQYSFTIRALFISSGYNFDYALTYHAGNSDVVTLDYLVKQLL